MGATGTAGWPSVRELEEWVRGLISAGRWQHTQRVAALARRLALRWGADVEAAEVAAIVHDCARELSEAALLKMVDDFGIVRDTISDAEPVLYHGPVAAAWVRSRWGIESPDVLEAIAVHTTGRPGMGLLARVLYAADALEPGRNFPEARELREQAFADLDAAVRATLELSITYLIKTGRLVHPDSLAARNALVLEAREGHAL